MERRICKALGNCAPPGTTPCADRPSSGTGGECQAGIPLAPSQFLPSGHKNLPHDGSPNERNFVMATAAEDVHNDGGAHPVSDSMTPLAAATKAGLTEDEVMATHMRKSFDYRLLHVLLHTLLKKPLDDLLLRFMRVDEMLIDIGDDLVVSG